MMKHLRTALPLIASLLVLAAANKPLCLGTGSNAAKCAKLKSQTACLRATDVNTTDVSASCIWHQMLGDSIKEVQQVTSTGAPLAITGLDFRGSGCGYNISMKLPSTAKGRWGLNFRLLGGPGNISDYTTTLSPRVAMSAAGCTVGKGAPSSCTVQLVAPQGYAQDPAFASNTVIIDFFTSDPNRIAEWRANGALSPENALSVRTTAEMLRCSNDSYPASPGVITDKVWFGTTSYSLYGDNDVKGYFSLTYRGYRLTNMTGAEWQVGVGKALSPNKTDLAVMLLTEADYLTWNNDCANRTCSPPFTLAIANTTCQGLKCTGSASGLKGDDAYRLVVAYPEVCGITNAACYSMDMPSKIGSPFAKELVSVVVTPKDWALAPPDNKAGKSVEVAEVVAAGTPGGEDSPLLAAGLVGLTGTLGSP